MKLSYIFKKRYRKGDKVAYSHPTEPLAFEGTVSKVHLSGYYSLVEMDNSKVGPKYLTLVKRRRTFLEKLREVESALFYSVTNDYIS